MYKITIEKIETKIINKKVYEKVADTGSKYDNGAQYGYVPAEVENTESITILEQRIENDKFDLAGVIKSVNSLQ